MPGPPATLWTWLPASRLASSWSPAMTVPPTMLLIGAAELVPVACASFIACAKVAVREFMLLISSGSVVLVRSIIAPIEPPLTG